MNTNKLAKNIKLAIFDADGVLTDGGLYFADDGTEFRRFNSLDGLGIKLLKNNGIEPAVITARTSLAVKNRIKELGIKYLYQAQNDKLVVFNNLIKKLHLKKQQCAFVGDDITDLPIMTQVGLPIAVANAHDLVKENAYMTTKKTGGNGAVREVCDFILKAQGKFDSAIESYLARPQSISQSLSMTKFQKHCYQTLKTQVPAGKVISYAGLAQLMGCPKSMRAVGQAMGKNPYAPTVPCHRVVKSNGELGGFNDAITVKIKRLKEEGVEVKDGKIINFKRHLFIKHSL